MSRAVALPKTGLATAPLSANLSKFKSTQLKQLAGHCGLNISGTKATIVADLVQTVEKGPENAHIQHDRPTTLLSVDLGLRNIALCHFAFSSVSQVPHITNWNLIGLEGLDQNRSLMQPVFASMALQLVKTAFISCDYTSADIRPNILPDIILIEQQRIRSSGSCSVPEHIAKINILEGMLHAILQTYVQEHNLSTHLLSVPAKRIMNYWIRNPAVLQRATTSKRYLATKKAKVNLVQSLLTENNDKEPVFTLEKPDLDCFLHCAKPKTKKDDLCDAFLQGLGWIMWQRNLARLRNVSDYEELETILNDIEQTYRKMNGYDEK